MAARFFSRVSSALTSLASAARTAAPASETTAAPRHGEDFSPLISRINADGESLYPRPAACICDIRGARFGWQTTETPPGRLTPRGPAGAAQVRGSGDGKPRQAGTTRKRTARRPALPLPCVPCIPWFVLCFFAVTPLVAALPLGASVVHCLVRERRRLVSSDAPSLWLAKACFRKLNGPHLLGVRCPNRCSSQ